MKISSISWHHFTICLTFTYLVRNYLKILFWISSWILRLFRWNLCNSVSVIINCLCVFVPTPSASKNHFKVTGIRRHNVSIMLVVFSQTEGSCLLRFVTLVDSTDFKICFSAPTEGEFAKDLCSYLSEYRLSDISYWIDRIKNCDLSDISDRLVFSVPGYHQASRMNKVREGLLRFYTCCMFLTIVSS